MHMKIKEVIAREKIFLENTRLWKSAFLQMVMLRKLEKRKISWDYAFSELGVQKPGDYDELLCCLDQPDIKQSQKKVLLALAMCLGFKKHILSIYFDVSTRYLRRIMLERKRDNFSFITGQKYRDRISRHLRADVQSVVSKTLHEPPSVYGINRTTWTINLLTSTINQGSSGLDFKVTRSNVSHAIRAMGYRFKKTREVLTSNDPNYKEKLAKITRTLQRLGPADRFFQ